MAETCGHKTKSRATAAGVVSRMFAQRYFFPCSVLYNVAACGSWCMVAPCLPGTMRILIYIYFTFISASGPSINEKEQPIDYHSGRCVVRQNPAFWGLILSDDIVSLPLFVLYLSRVERILTMLVNVIKRYLQRGVWFWK